MTIRIRMGSALGGSIAFSAAFCLILSGIACDGFVSQRSCVAIQSDTAGIASGGVFTEEDRCRIANLTLESADAGCSDLDSADREFFVGQAEQFCGE